MRTAKLLAWGTLRTAVIASVILLPGCSTSKVALDKPAIEQSRRIGVFVWHGGPFFDQRVGAGILGTGGSIGTTLYSAVSGESRRTVQSIYESGLYEAFELQFVKNLSTKLSVPVSSLSDNDYIHQGSGKTRKIDVLGSSRAQGYDAVFETFVWPSLVEHQVDVSRYEYEASLKINLIVRRVNDGKVLWKVSYKASSGPGPHYDFKALAGQAAETGINRYISGK